MVATTSYIANIDDVQNEILELSKSNYIDNNAHSKRDGDGGLVVLFDGDNYEPDVAPFTVLIKQLAPTAQCRCCHCSQSKT